MIKRTHKLSIVEKNARSRHKKYRNSFLDTNKMIGYSPVQRRRLSKYDFGIKAEM